MVVVDADEAMPRALGEVLHHAGLAGGRGPLQQHGPLRHHDPRQVSEVPPALHPGGEVAGGLPRTTHGLNYVLL